MHSLLRTHQLCRSISNDIFLPTRLIHVDAYTPDSLDVRLLHRSSVPPGSKYNALSYCRGDHRPSCITFSSNIQRQIERISWSALPATFQHAVDFTRSLGVQYLWIDSVCIIQQEPGKFCEVAERDWAEESATMFHVYKNAYVTLAALYGYDSQSSTLR